MNNDNHYYQHHLLKMVGVDKEKHGECVEVEKCLKTLVKLIFIVFNVYQIY